MISVIIAAAGSGTRMGGSVKKQYRKIENLTVLEKTVKAFFARPGDGSVAQKEIGEIVIAGPKEDLDYIRELFARPGDSSVALFAGKPIKVVAGGATREESVWNALMVCKGDYVLIHDAARCFVDTETIGRVIDALGEKSPAVIPCVRPKSTIRTAGATLNRDELYEVQTPQGFERTTLVRAFEKARADGFCGTDEGSIVDHYGLHPVLVEGDYKNIKITTEDDMPKCDLPNVACAESAVRVGYGYDVHKLVPGRKLMLGCVEIPHDKGLLGHSDADVLVHAIADAMLGAAALRDIGYYFPDTAAETEGMPGAALLAQTLKLVNDAGFKIVNVDGTIVAQQPKLAPHIEKMKEAIAEVLGISPDQVGVKATTEEGLGITGNGDAMAAHAVAVVTERI